MKRTYLIIIVLSFTMGLSAQSGFSGFYNQSIKVNKTGMIILGTWAISNIGIGALNYGRTVGSDRYFHQMNMMWNTVNLGIAGVSFYLLGNEEPLRMTSQEMMDKHLLYKKLYLVNAGLDLLYMGGGYLMKKRAAFNATRAEMFTGYGNSIMLQGAFLFLFDAGMFLTQHVRQMNFLNDFHLSYLPEGSVMISYISNF